MKSILNAVRAQATLANNDRASARLGIVQSYDPSTHCAKVLIKPEDFETGWIPVTSNSVGNGWGIFSPPSPGEMVSVHFQDGSIDAGFVSGRFWSDAARPVAEVEGEHVGCPSGEIWMLHKSGSALKFGNDGIISLVSEAGIVSSSPAWTHTGPFTLHGDLVADGGAFSHKGVNVGFDHPHIDVQAGSDLSGPPAGGIGGGSSGAADGAAAGDYWLGLG